MKCLSLLIIAVIAGSVAARAAAVERSSANVFVQPLASTGVHNLFRATTNIFSGSAPDSDAAFAEIAKLGVKIIISVDGAKPDAETARKHGLHYVHLPIGYDGVSSNRLAELVKAAQTVSGPIYVHCHHGKHRGPAAVAVICEATAGWTTNQAVAWLRKAGTASEYGGLYRSAMEFRLPDAAALAKVHELPEVAKTTSLVDAMVAMDEEMERLKLAQENDWKSIPNQPDVTPSHTATILWEHLRELARTDDTAKRPAEFRARLAESEKTADQFRGLQLEVQASRLKRDAAFQALNQTCSACHKLYRN